MISPINLSAKAGIAPVPKPPKAVSFTGMGNVTTGLKTAKKAIFDMASEFVETAKFAGIKSAVRVYAKEAMEWLKKPKFISKVSDFAGGIVNKVKNLRISDRMYLFFETVRNTNFVKSATKQVSKIFK